MTNLHQAQSRDRRATMTTEQRANLDRLALVIERYRVHNDRFARGLEIGFRQLEATNAARIALAEVK